MRILVVIPTTGGLLIIRSLKPRPALPASAAFADGDYRPLPWSGDYARLAGPGGPLMRAGLCDGKAHELRLSGSFDTGRSWEAPVALAHALLAKGHPIVGEVAHAQLLVWATGAIDLDLALIAGSYSLLDKLDLSQAFFAEASGKPIMVLLPPDEVRQAAALRVSARDDVLVIAATAIDEAAQRIDKASRGAAAIATSDHTTGARARRLWPLLGGLALASGTAGVAALFWPQSETRIEPAAPAAIETVAKAPLVPAPVIIEALRAPAGATCRQVVFDAAQPTTTPVALSEVQTFETTRNDVSLCGLSFRAREPGAVAFEVAPALRNIAPAPSRRPDGREIFYLREQPRQNIVYFVQVFTVASGVRKPVGAFTHRLAP